MRNQPNPGDAQGTCYTPPRSMGVLGSSFSTDRLAVPTWPANAGKQLLLAATPPARAAATCRVGIAYDIASQLPLMRPSLDADSAHLAFCEGRCVRAALCACCRATESTGVQPIQNDSALPRGPAGASGAS